MPKVKNDPESIAKIKPKVIKGIGDMTTARYNITEFLNDIDNNANESMQVVIKQKLG